MLASPGFSVSAFLERKPEKSNLMVATVYFLLDGTGFLNIAAGRSYTFSYRKGCAGRVGGSPIQLVLPRSLAFVCFICRVFIDAEAFNAISPEFLFVYLSSSLFSRQICYVRLRNSGFLSFPPESFFLLVDHIIFFFVESNTNMASRAFSRPV